MRMFFRQAFDGFFSALCSVSVALLAAALLVFLTPMLGRGARAVFFGATVEFRKMQRDLYRRGDTAALNAEIQQTDAARKPIYDLLERFSLGIDTQMLESRVKSLFRQYGEDLRFRDKDRQVFAELRDQARQIRDLILAALQTDQKEILLSKLDEALAYRQDSRFVGTAIETMMTLAADYRQVVETLDISHRADYADQLSAVKEQLRALFGPLPGEPTPALAMYRYGATRADIVQRHLRYLIWQEKWVCAGPGKPLQKTYVRRDDPTEGAFAGTALAPLFAMVEQSIDQTMRPRFTFYWQYFIDDSTPGHYFGGVGPELLGTVLLTALAMLFAVPLGVISAAYLVEYAGDNIVVKIIRTCINTLAGVPSVVYGLFGLAFFVMLVGHPCILTASMTLALLSLPVIIRASEEAIRAVPQSYRQASLALGAGKFRTFLTVTLPAAAPGILTGVILSLSRAAGDTATILFAGAVALGPVPDFSGKWWLQPTRALSYGCYDITVGDKLAMLAPHNQFGMVATLIVLVLALNLTAICIRFKMSRSLRGH